MNRMASITSAIFISAMASACTGRSMIIDTTYHGSYNSLNFTTYHAGRDTELRVLGEASFGIDKAALGAAVGQAMHGEHFGRPSNFTLTPGASAEKNLYAVMSFNMSDASDLCESADKLTFRPTKGKTVLQAAWCWSGQTQSYVLIHAPLTRTGEAAFADIVAQATRELFRPNPDVEGRKDSDDLPP